MINALDRVTLQRREAAQRRAATPPSRLGHRKVQGPVADALRKLFEAGLTPGRAAAQIGQSHGVRITSACARTYRHAWGFPPGRPGGARLDLMESPKKDRVERDFEGWETRAVEVRAERQPTELPPILDAEFSTFDLRGRAFTHWLRELLSTDERVFLLQEPSDGMVTMAG